MNMKGESIMKKIIPFKKDIIFKTNISEITSISLENTLSKENDNGITGEFIVSGEYKMSDESIHTENFSYELPFDIHMDEKYNLGLQFDKEKIARYQIFSESFFMKHYAQMDATVVLTKGKNEWRKKEKRSKQLDVFLRLKGVKV